MKRFAIATFVAFLCGVASGRLWWAWNWLDAHDPTGRLSLSDVVDARLQIATILVTTAAGAVALWVGWLTRRLVLSAQEQLSLLRRESADAELDRYRRNKPIVLTELGRDGTYTMRNVGEGPALNVYILVPGQTQPGTLGGLGVNEERQLTGWVQNHVHGAPQPWSHVLIAEGIRTRTRRWNPTLNAGLVAIRLVAHDLFDPDPASQMWDDRDMSIDGYVEQQGETLRVALEVFKRRETADEDVD